MNCRDYLCTMVRPRLRGGGGDPRYYRSHLARSLPLPFLPLPRLLSSFLPSPRISPHLLFFAERRSKTNAEKSSCEHALARNGCMRSCSAEARLSGTRSKERFKKWWYSLLHFAWFFSLGGPCGRDERDGEVQCACRVSALPCVFKGVLYISFILHALRYSV